MIIPRPLYDVLVIGGLSATLGATGCSSSSQSSDGTGGAGGEEGGIAMFNTTAGADGGALLEDGGAAAQLGASACTAEVRHGETIPVDIYIMFDQSGSMATPVGTGTRLDAVRAAIESFLHSTDSTGLGVGIGYFGYMPIGATSCDPADYANAAVPVATLPDNAQAVLDSLNSIMPTGETPTGAAVRGGCGYTQTVAQANPSHVVSMLLVTDGVPEAPVSSMTHGCIPTLDDAVQATTDCLNGSPGIKTYVIGIGPSLTNLNQIAASGGTTQAYLVEQGDVSAQVLQALNDVRGSASIPCELQIPAPPAGKTLDYSLINVLYTDPSGTQTNLYNVGDVSQCDPAAGGWYYDNPASPQKIVLCDATCKAVKFETGGKLDYALGCKTMTKPVR